MKLINRVLLRLGYILVPAPPGPKSLREHANTSESFHPARGGRTVDWMRTVADLMERKA